MYTMVYLGCFSISVKISPLVGSRITFFIRVLLIFIKKILPKMYLQKQLHGSYCSQCLSNLDVNLLTVKVCMLINRSNSALFTSQEKSVTARNCPKIRWSCLNLQGVPEQWHEHRGSHFRTCDTCGTLLVFVGIKKLYRVRVILRALE